MTACDQKGLSLSPDFEILHDILHGSQFSIQPASLGGDAVQLPPEVGDVGFEEGLQALPHSPGTLLLQEAPFGLQDLVLLLQEPHLVNEGGELVVEGLDLLSLLFPHPLDVGVDLQVEGSQETLVDGDLLDASRGTDGEAAAPVAPSNSTPIAESTAYPKPAARPATKATSEVAATPTDGDPLGSSQVVEATAAEAADPSQSSTAHRGVGHGHGAEARAASGWGGG